MCAPWVYTIVAVPLATKLVFEPNLQSTNRDQLVSDPLDSVDGPGFVSEPLDSPKPHQPESVSDPQDLATTHHPEPMSEPQDLATTHHHQEEPGTDP